MRYSYEADADRVSHSERFAQSIENSGTRMATQKRTDGEQIRRLVMGAEFVDAALEGASDYELPLQELTMEHAWGVAWTRDELDLKTRSMITISMLIAQRAFEELKGHLRGALNNGVTPSEIREVIIHSAVYCGYPAALSAMRVAKEVVNVEGATATP